MQYKKPSYVAEFGIVDEVRKLFRKLKVFMYSNYFKTITIIISTQTEDKAGVSLHNGVWAPLFSMAAGTCM